jgi:prepilin-type N-terminal cleavage/methylation domain-containing protein
MKKSAFTLIELLIVVAVIAILAAIAVPNFLEAQTRSKVSRAQNDLRTMALAAQAYMVDNNTFPPRTCNPGTGEMFSPLGRYQYDGDRIDYRLLTTPIAYLDRVPSECFPFSWDTFDYRGALGITPLPYRAYSGGFHADSTGEWTDSYGGANKMWNGFLFQSNGPDDAISNASIKSARAIIANEALPVDQQKVGGYKTSVYTTSWIYFSQPGFRGMRYDPTNGTKSVGDIYRLGGLANNAAL